MRAGSAAAWLAQALLALGLGVAVFVAITGRSGGLRHLEHVADDRVGVLVDHRARTVRGIGRSGYQVVVPRLQAVHTLTRSPVEYVMQGDQRVDANHVPRLVVRARDGARFWFERVSIRYALDAARPELALLDSGPDDGFREGLVDGFARSVLQAELGAHTAADIVLPENRRAATERVQERLAASLAGHGVVVHEVALSNPRFDERYEQLIERRKVAEQDIERLTREAELLLAGQAQEERHLERKLALQLAKDTDLWRRELEELEHAARTLEATRAERVAQLERERELALGAARAGWSRTLAAAEHELAKLERTRGPRLAAVRDQARRAGAIERVECERRGVALREALARLAAEHGPRVEEVRGEAELARSVAAAELAAERSSAEREGLLLVAAAEIHAAEREQLGLLEGAARRDRAAELSRRHAREAELFGALARTLEATGEAGVRAALVEAVAGVEIELGRTGIDEPRLASSPVRGPR